MLAACQKDSKLRELKATIELVEPYTPPEDSGADGKKKKKNKKTKGKGKDNDAASSSDVPVERVPTHLFVLSDTVVFPEGGGQPSDTGSIRPSCGGSWDVLHCRRDPESGRIEHLVCRTRGSAADGGSDGNGGCEDAGSPAAGSEALVTVDWARRWDHTQQHSAQHVASAIAESEAFGAWNTTSWNLGEAVCSVEFDVDRDKVTQEKLDELERAVNDIARQAKPVTWAVDGDGDGDADGGNQKDGAEEGGDEVARASRGINNSGGRVPVRHVIIEGIDRNPCCGTHVTLTSEYAPFKILGTEVKHRGATNVIFAAGDRVIRIAEEGIKRESELSALLTTIPSRFAESVSRVQSELRDRSRRIAQMEPELARFVGADIAREVPEADGGAGQIAWCFRDSGGAGMPFLMAARDAVAEARPAAIFVGIATPSPTEKAGVYLVQGGKDDHERAAEIAAAIASCVDGKGGGKNGRIQGKAAAITSKTAKEARAKVFGEQ